MPEIKTQKNKKEILIKAIPSEITVFGRKLKVTITNLKGLHGDFNIDKNLIRLHQNQTVEEARATLFHEALHAAFALSGHGEMLKDNQEESLIRMLEHAFFHIIDVNKLTTGIDK